MSTLNILRVVQNESYGDHGETTTRAIEPDRDMTLGELADLYLTKSMLGRESDPDAYLVIRYTLGVPTISPLPAPGEEPF